MQLTKIEWCDYSSSLLKYRNAVGKTVHACVKISPGCSRCYAESIATRFDGGRKYTLPMTEGVTPFFDDAEAQRILRSKKLAGKRVFIDDMTDLFGDWVPNEIILRHLAVFAIRQDVTFQVLTKRSKRLATLLNRRNIEEAISETLDDMRCDDDDLMDQAKDFAWPLPNVWLGCSVEDQKRAEERIPDLIETPAAVRFLSVEPFLDKVDLSYWLTEPLAPQVDWVIAGGESGPGARRMQVEWARQIVGQCKQAKVDCFVKQMGSNVYDCAGCYLSGKWPWKQRWNDAYRLERVKLESAKGGDPSEWPADLRVREMPVGKAVGA